MVVQDIEEVVQYLELKFKVNMQWKDARVMFYNIKTDEKMNSLSLDEQLALWTPTVVFWNTKNQLTTVNDENTFASIKREASGSIIDKAANEDIETFTGSDNGSTISLVYSIRFYCEYQMVLNIIRFFLQYFYIYIYIVCGAEIHVGLGSHYPSQ